MNNFDFKARLVSFWETCKRLPWKRIGLICLCSFLALVLIVLIFATAYIESILAKIERVDPNETITPQPSGIIDPNFTDPTIPSIPGVTVPTEPDTIISHKDIINIMLVGQDRRSGNYLTNSDAMILCTFNTKKKTITMTSFMRDLYVNIPGHGMNKLNAAYPKGGMGLLGETLMQNFGVQVDSFVEIDFNGFKKVVNTLDGIDMYLTAEEAHYMNTTPWDGLNSDGWALHEGVNHLNGDQALAYSRIRHVGFYDYERTERQRKVLSAIIAKCNGMNLTTALDLMNELLPLVRTDMSDSEITGYAGKLFPMLSGSNIVTQRIPIEGSYVDTHNIILPDYELNHQFLVDTLLPD